MLGECLLQKSSSNMEKPSSETKRLVKIAFIYYMIKECNYTVEFVFSNDLYDWLQV